MKVLMITGDKRFGFGHPRYELQKSAVEQLDVLYWGKAVLLPRIPRTHYDVVTVQDPFWRGLFGWMVARRVGARFNVQVHTDLSAYSLVRHMLAQIVLRHADSVRVVSDKIKSQVEALGVRGKVHVLPVFVDLEKFKMIIPRPHDAKHILWIGRLEQEKNPLAAIDVLEDVQQVEPNAVLTIVGSGAMEREVRAYAHSKPHTRPIFTGWAEDLSGHLETADVVLCTSWHESFGASIIEALAAGVPVVAPDVGVAKEAGATVVPRSDLATAVVRVLKEGTRGKLLLAMPDAKEWKKLWRESL